MGSTPSIIEIGRLAANFRAAIESCDRLALPIPFRDFPRGSCGVVSDLLGVYLASKGYTAFEVVSGERGQESHGDWNSHAWLEGYGLIVDITADQFGEAHEKVIVIARSEWHSAYVDQQRGPPSISGYAIVGELIRANSLILRAMGRAT